MAKKGIKGSGGKKSSGKSPGRGWFTKSEAAAVFGVSETYFDRDYRQLAPDDAVKTKDGRLYFRLRALIDGLVERKIEEEREQRGAAGDDSALIAGPETEWLDKLRMENALIRRMERLEREGRLVPRETIDPALDRLAIVIRRMGETLGRRFGNDATDIVNEAVDEVAGVWERMYGGRIGEGQTEGNGGGAEPELVITVVEDGAVGGDGGGARGGASDAGGSTPDAPADAGTAPADAP